jgi:hypothetical protein
MKVVTIKAVEMAAGVGGVQAAAGRCEVFGSCELLSIVVPLSR